MHYTVSKKRKRCGVLDVQKGIVVLASTVWI